MASTKLVGFVFIANVVFLIAVIFLFNILRKFRGDQNYART